MTRKTLTMLALAGMTAVTISTAVIAQDAPMGGRGGFDMLNFEAMDADKDGKLTEAEIEAARVARVTAADANGDGKLSAEELSAMHLAMMTERSKDMAAKMVERLDSDADGMLTAAEMAAGPGMGRMFDKIDADGDDAITQAEVDAAKDQMGKGHRKGRGGHGEGHGMGHGWGFGGDN